MNDSTLSTVKFWLPDEIKDFGSMARLVKYRKKTNLFWAGDDPESVYFIASGFIKIFHYTPVGNTITLLLHKPGDIVGIGGALENSVRGVSAETTGPSELWVFSREVFLKMMYDYPKFAVWVATDLASRMKRIDQSLYHVVSLSADCRLALTLLDLAEQSGDREDGVQASVSATHQDIANLIGICRQTTTSILSRFRSEGIIDTNKGRIDIYKLDRLREIAAEAGLY